MDTHTHSAHAHINLIILLILTKQANKQTNNDNENDNNHLCPYTTEYNSGKAQDKLSIHIAKLISIQSLCVLEKPIAECV